MDTYEAIVSKLDVREFSSKHVPGEIKRKIFEAARMTGSSNNTQHWRFILIEDRANVKRLAEDSLYGGWVASSDFAVIILTDPKVPGSLIDGGRVLQDMQLAAWNFGVISRLFTTFKREELHRDFGVPAELHPTAALGFGYPARKILGKKNRKPLEEIFFSERYGRPVDLERLAK